MAFGEGFKHTDSAEYLEDGNYTAKIIKAEIVKGSYGDYVQAEVEVEGHPGCNPHIFLLNDSPKSAYGSLSLEDAMNIWNKNMTKFFKNFSLQENFNVASWIGHSGTITVRQQKKNPQYKEIVPYVVTTKSKNVSDGKTNAAATPSSTASDFPEDMIF
ncbi:MAG: hypothetical protein MJ174_07550 [Treponema sp.]|nr:hypothetical protein [Treponema sp.]